VLIAETAGGTGVRLAVERCLRSRGWPLAAGPSDADVLVVCGEPDPELHDALQTTWRAMPGPRARVHLRTVEDVPARLTQAASRLADLSGQRADAGQRPIGVPDDPTPEAEAEHGGMDHGDMQMDMDMSLPGGLVMADRADDRDGLKLDVLHLRLCPFLPSWPGGLAVDVTLQGDVVQEASVEVRSAPGAVSFWDSAGERDPARRVRLLAAAHLDSAGRLLRLTGWVAAAEVAGRLCDDTLDGAPVAGLLGQVRRLRVRVSRSARPRGPADG
jgi:hypothetical protein